MEKLNFYLQTLLSTRSHELNLEPNRVPSLISASGVAEAGTEALTGTQISMMVFPLIPGEVKAQLPGRSEVEFVYSHRLGKFTFLVKKSPGGFNVIVRPVLINSAAPRQEPPAAPKRESPTSNGKTPQYAFQSSSAALENNAAIKVNSALPELEIGQPIESKPVGKAVPKVEVVPVNSPEFSTVFSEHAVYEPPGKHSDFIPPGSEYTPPPIDYSVQQSPPVEKANSPAVPAQQAVQEPMTAAPAPAAQFSVEQEAPKSGFVPVPVNPQARAGMDSLFRKMAEIGASDLHLSVSMPPMVRKDGKMQVMSAGEAALTPEAMRQLLISIMPPRNQEEFARRNDTDFAYEIPELARFRANVFTDRKGMGGVFRIIPTKILTAEQLGLSSAIMDLCSLSKGLVVVTGPTGSGKSTTLCAMIDHINKNREDHIITIEDPIEFVHENNRCLVNQREVGNHTDSFKDALRAALREDPDILLVGEMRDLETISIAIETAETGHLVFGTLHTTTAASTVDRIIDQFPADRQQQIRVMLSESLKGVIAQTLLPKKGGGRIAALEILIVTPAISNLIREGKTFQIPSAMQTGRNVGMVMLNDALFNLVQKGIVEPRDAYIKAVDKMGFESMLTRAGFKI